MSIDICPDVTDSQWNDAQQRHWSGTREQYAGWRRAKDAADAADRKSAELTDILARRAAAAERFLDTVDALEAVVTDLLALELRTQELRGFRHRSCRSLMTFARNLATDATRDLRPSSPRISRLRRDTARAALLDLARRPER